jgi:hypothetical protein
MTEVVVGHGEVVGKQGNNNVWVFEVTVNGRAGLFTVGGPPQDTEAFLREHVENYLKAHPDKVEGIVSTDPSNSDGEPAISNGNEDENGNGDEDPGQESEEDENGGSGGEDEGDGGDSNEEDGDNDDGTDDGEGDSTEDQQTGTGDQEGDGVGGRNNRLEELMADAIARGLHRGETTSEEETFDFGRVTDRQRLTLAKLAAKVASGEIILHGEQPGLGDGLGNGVGRVNNAALGILLANALAAARDPYRQEENGGAAEGYDDVPGHRGPVPNS